MKSFRAFLIYDRPRLARNGWLVKAFQEKFTARGWTLEVKLAEDLTENLTENLTEKPDLPDAVLMRCVRPDLSRMWERAGVCVLNCAKTAEIANDKWKTFQFLNPRGIPMMETRELNLETPLPFPFVLKSKDGHGGTEVFQIEKEEQLRKMSIAPAEENRWIVQPLCSSPGRDVRVYIVGNRIVTAMERTSSTDFRSNFSLGGSARVYELSEEEKELVSRILALLDLDFGGVDLIFHEGRAVLNEIEDVVGSRMLYAETELDILEIFLDHVQRKIERS